MNYYFFDRDVFEKHYNCSYYDVDLHPIQERQNLIYGIGLIVISVVFELLYAPLVIVLWQPYFQGESCYRLMSIIVVIDMIAVVISGILAGYYSIIGAVYCTHPWQMLLIGCLGFFVWIIESTLAIILAFNRCICIASSSFADKIFQGFRTYIWVMVAVTYGFVVCLTTNTVVYTSIVGVWIFNPHFGYPQSGFNYANKWQPMHNTAVAFSLLFLYILFIIILIKKKYNNVNQNIFSHRQKPIFIQVLVVSLLNFTIALLYVYEQYFPTPKWLMQVSEVGWLCIHGVPSIIYILFNRSVQKRIKLLVFNIPYTNSITPVGGIFVTTDNKSEKTVASSPGLSQTPSSVPGEARSSKSV